MEVSAYLDGAKLKRQAFMSVQWDATDSMARPVSAGVYLDQIQAGEFVEIKKMVLLKWHLFVKK